MTTLRFGVLGPLALWRDGAPIEVPSGRRRAVLAMLVARAGHAVSAAELIGAGWGEHVPDRPGAALHTVISRLRTLLGEGLLCTDPAGYRLAVSADSIDSSVFENLREQATQSPAREAADLLGEALGVWRGPAYVEFPDQEFLAMEARRLDLLRLEAIEAQAEVLGEVGELDRAIAGLERLLAEQPYREQAVALLMRVLYRAGRAVEALDWYRRYREELSTELGLEPAPALQALQQRILGHDPLLAGSEHPTGSPAAIQPPAWLDVSAAFIGRESARTELVEAVAGNRLVNVTGPGGVGKTRLAAQALPDLVDRLAIPVTIVELAPVSGPQVDAALADALGLEHRGGDTRAACLEYLSITTGLLVLDNCEHVLAPVVALVDAIGRQCPGIRVLATSRHRLGLRTEQVLVLEPLPVPTGASTADLDASPAAQLFVDRMRRVRPTSRPGEHDPALLSAICRLLDGLPLALELAAARAAITGLEPVLRQLRDSLGAQISEESVAPYEEMTAVVDWSLALLGPRLQRIFTELSVFVGEFDAIDAGGLVRIAGPEADDVVAVLAELVDASLLVTRHVDGGVRHRMLTVVRARAARHLARSGQELEMRAGHARWACQVASAAAADQADDDGTEVFKRLDRLRGDLTEALRWSVSTGNWEVGGELGGRLALCRLWPAGLEIADLVAEVAVGCAALPDPSALALAAGAAALAERGEVSRSWDLGSRALALAATSEEQFLSRATLGVATVYSGDHQESRRWWQEITVLDVPVSYRAEAHISLALLACFHDELVTAGDEATTARAITEVTGPAAIHAFARYAQGEVALKQDLKRGATLLADATREADLAGASHVSRVARVARCAALVRLGHHGDAFDLIGPLLADARRAGAWPQLWTTLRVLAELLAACGADQDAAFLLAATRAAPTAPPIVGDDVERYDALDRRLRQQLGPGVTGGIDQFAAGVRRTQVVDRATAVVLREAHAGSGPD